MIEKGMLLRVQTRTKDDVFGDVMYEVVETGLAAPEKGREGQMDGVKVVMLGGSGPRARAGLTLIDSEKKIKEDMATGITSIVPAEKRESILAHYTGRSAKATGESHRHGGTGVIEV